MEQQALSEIICILKKKKKNSDIGGSLVYKFIIKKVMLATSEVHVTYAVLIQVRWRQVGGSAALIKPHLKYCVRFGCHFDEGHYLLEVYLGKYDEGKDGKWT